MKNVPKKFILSIFVSVLSLTLLSIPALGSYSQKYQVIHDTFMSVGDNGNSRYFVGQRIALGTDNETISSASFFIKRGATASLTYRYRIYGTSPATLIAETAEYNDSELSTTGAWIEHDFETPVSYGGDIRIGVFHSAQNDPDDMLYVGIQDSDIKSGELLSVHNTVAYTDYSAKDCAYIYQYDSDTFDLSSSTLDIYPATPVQGLSGNWTIHFSTVLNTNSTTSPSIVSGHLGTTIGGYENDSDLSSYFVNADSGKYTYIITTQGDGTVFPLSSNTTYYYQSYAIVDNVTLSSDILEITLGSSGNYTTSEFPSVSISGIKNVSSGYELSRQPVILVEAQVESDYPIIYKEIRFSLTTKDGFLLSPRCDIISNQDLTSDNKYSVLLFLGEDTCDLGWSTGTPVYVQAFAKNKYGTGYSKVEVITSKMSEISTETTTPMDIIEQQKNKFGLSGAFGEWAMLAIIEIIIALVFGVCLAVEKEKMVRAGIGLTWIISSAGVLGAYMFSGKLGILPIVIVVTIVSAIAIMFIGRLFSGNKVSDGI